MIKNCIICEQQIHPKRLEILPKTKTCVECSSSEKKAGVTVMQGEGDHTYVETIIMEASEYRKYMEAEHKVTQLFESDPDMKSNTITNEDGIDEPLEINGLHEIDSIDE
jgi:hypothetical protein